MVLAMYIKKKKDKKWFYKLSDLRRWDAARESWGWVNPFKTADNTPVE